MELNAETEYLFQHATVRDAAYQLLPTSNRAKLHQYALDILEELTLGHSLETVFELAEHARLAQQGVTLFGDSLGTREIRYLRLSAHHATGKYENDQAATLWLRVADHKDATDAERADALIEAALLHWMLGRREISLQSLTRILELADATPQQQITALIERGTLYRDVRDHSAAAADLESALTLARKWGDKSLELRALGNLCTIQDANMTQASATKMYEPVIALAREINDDRAIGITEGQIAAACMRSGNFEDAEQHLNESIRKLHLAGDKINESANYSVLGDVFLTRTDGDRRRNLMYALECYRLSLNIKEQIGYVFQKTEPLLGMAATHREMGTLSEAAKYANETLKLAAEIGDPLYIGSAYLELGRLNELTQSFSEAERMYAYGFVAVEDSQLDGLKIKLLSALAKLLAAQGDWEAAKNHAENAVELSAKLKDRETRKSTRRLLREIASKGN